MERPHKVKTTAIGKTVARHAHRPIEQEIQELTRDIPAKVWAALPSDLPGNVDHYLYGLPK